MKRGFDQLGVVAVDTDRQPEFDVCGGIGVGC